MRFLLRGLLLAAALAGGACAADQTSLPRTPSAKATTWKRYCQPAGGFCFKYPSSWLMVGEIFAGHGVVVAPQQTQDRELWNAITVAMVVPPPEGVARASYPASSATEPGA